MVMPFAYMLGASFKLNNEIYELSLLPREPTLDNYRRLFERSGFLRWFGNSLLVGTVTTASVLFFDSLVGYTLAKFRFRGRYLVFVAILSTLMIPTEMLVLPWYSMAKTFGWLDTYWGIAFPGLMTGFGTFLMKQFFEGVPDELLDAGRLDGLNEFQVWWQVAMPLVTPALSALAIFTFLGNWTAFLWPLDRHHRPESLYIAGGPRLLLGRVPDGMGDGDDRSQRGDDPDDPRVPAAAALHHPRHRAGGAQGMSMSAAGPSQGANCACSGSSAAARAASVGAHQ